MNLCVLNVCGHTQAVDPRESGTRPRRREGRREERNQQFVKISQHGYSFVLFNVSPGSVVSGFAR